MITEITMAVSGLETILVTPVSTSDSFIECARNNVQKANRPKQFLNKALLLTKK